MKNEIKNISIDPLKKANEGVTYKGFVTIAKLPRVMEVTTSDKGFLEVVINFEILKTSVASIEILVNGELELCCQRTLDPFIFSLSTRSLLAAVNSEVEMNYLPEEYEPVILDDDLLSLYDIIEEEVLLAIPFIPKSQLNDCQTINNKSYYTASKTPEHKQEGGNKSNPFDILRGLKEGKD